MRRHFSSITTGFNFNKQKIEKTVKSLPWNFNAHLRHEKVQNVIAPVDLGRAFLGNEDATSLFKDYVDAIFTNDFETIKENLEPTFYNAAKQSVANAHNLIRPPM